MNLCFRSFIIVWFVQSCLGISPGSAAAAPVTTVSPAAGYYGSAQNVTLTCNDGSGPGCATTCYTTDGSTPACGTITIVQAAYGTPMSYIESSHSFTANTPQCTAAGSSLSVVSTACNGKRSCSITASNGNFGDPCVGVYKRLFVVYQCSGQYFFSQAEQNNYASLSCPGTLYSSPISIGGNTSLKFFSIDLAGASESVKTATYTFDFTAPVTTASPSSGFYGSPQNVALSCTDSGSGCQTTYYCLGSDCAPATVYTGSTIGIAVPTALRYYSTDGAGNAESVKVTGYFITSPADMNLTPSSLDAGRLPVGASGIAQAVVLANSGGSGLEITGIPATAGDFAVSHNCPASLAAGARCTLNVVFSPTQAGVRDAILTIGGQSVTLTGTGTIAADCIVIDPVTSTTLYAGLDGAGIYKSIDSGATWTPADTQPASKRVKALAINKSDSTKLYAATYGGGVFGSTDSGDHWTVCANTNLTNLNLVSLSIDATGKLYAGTEAGVFVSSDNCASWNALNTGLPL